MKLLEAPTLFGSLARCLVIEVSPFYRNQQGRRLPPFHLLTEADPVFETSRSLEYQTMDEVQKLDNPE
jgi:hypothetical protein